MAKIEFNQDKCIKCGLCVMSCPASVINQPTKSAFPTVMSESDCIDCGHCVMVCPQDAVIHTTFPIETIKQVNRPIIPSAEQVQELIRTRRSIRVFKKKPVEKELIEKIIEGSRFAPSAHNSQSTEYIIIQDRKMLDEIVNLTAQYLSKMIKLFRNPVMKAYLLMSNREMAEGALKALPQIDALVAAVKKRHDLILYDAPVLILVHAKRRVLFGDVNAHLALQNAALVAHSLGLGSFYTGFILAACERDKAIQNYLGLPDNDQIFGGLAIGYPEYKYNKWIERNPPSVKWY